jgi:outer membrane lipoprotein-sorting protein
MKGLQTGYSTRSFLRRVAGLAGVLALGSLTGCFGVKTYSVSKTEIAPNVQAATLDELLGKMAAEYSGVQTLNLKVNITATEGGEHKGEVNELPSFAGYILLRKPNDLRVIMQVPVLRSEAMDMVSDGQSFKLVIPPKSRAIVGSETAPQGKASGLYNLRPNDVRVALQIPPVGPDDLVALTLGSRILTPAKGRKGAVEEPDYDVTVMRAKPSESKYRELERVRVIHIGRTTLLPYEQDLYDHEGRLVETIRYDKYAKFGDVDYPMSIFLKRPLSEYTLQIDLLKVTINQEMDDEQFKLDIPDGMKVEKMQ